MNIWNLGSKESLRVKFKDGIWVELCLKLLFKSNWYFCNVTESEWFWKQLFRIKVLNNLFLKSVWKVTVQKTIAELWTVISFPQTKFDPISDHSHDINLHGNLSTKLLAQEANKNTKFMFMKTGWLLFSEVWFQKWLFRKILNKHCHRLKK